MTATTVLPRPKPKGPKGPPKDVPDPPDDGMGADADDPATAKNAVADPTPEADERGSAPAPTADFPTDPAGKPSEPLPPLPDLGTPGFRYVRGNAIKLLLVLRHLGGAGKATHAALAEAAGLSVRIIQTLLDELSSHGLVAADGVKGDGTRWELLPPPRTLPEVVGAKEEKRLKAEEARLREREEQLEEDRRRLDAAMGAAG